MKRYRAFFTDGTMMEGTFRGMYEAALWLARNDNTSAKIYDAGHQDWSWLNNLEDLPIVTVRAFDEDGLVIVTNYLTGNYVTYKTGNYWKEAEG